MSQNLGFSGLWTMGRPSSMNAMKAGFKLTAALVAVGILAVATGCGGSEPAPTATATPPPPFLDVATAQPAAVAVLEASCGRSATAAR